MYAFPQIKIPQRAIDHAKVVFRYFCDQLKRRLNVILLFCFSRWILSQTCSTASSSSTKPAFAWYQAAVSCSDQALITLERPFYHQSIKSSRCSPNSRSFISTSFANGHKCVQLDTSEETIILIWKSEAKKFYLQSLLDRELLFFLVNFLI